MPAKASSTPKVPNPSTPASTAPEVEALNNFRLAPEQQAELSEIARTRGIDVVAHLHCAVAQVINELKPLSPQHAEELVDRALCVGISCYNYIGQQPGVLLSTHGFMEHLQLSEQQALRFVCRTLMAHSGQMMEMSFKAFHGSRREIAHALLVAESVCFKAGEDFVVTSVKETEAFQTACQLFGLLCESVETYAEFESCLAERTRQAGVSDKESRASKIEHRLAEAERTVQALRAEQGKFAA